MARAPRRSAASDLLADDPHVDAIARLLKKPKRTLADYHKIGRKFGELTADPGVTAGGTKWKEEVAKQVGASEATLNKCLQFSRAYEPGELKELEELEDRWARITVSLAVKDRDERHRLLRAARDEGWTDRDLQKQIQQRRGTKRGGGRERRPPRSHGLQADTSSLFELLQAVDEFLNHVWLPNRARYREEAAGLEGEAQDTTRRVLDRVRQMMSEVGSGLDFAGKDLDAYQRRIPGDGTGRSGTAGNR